MSHEELLVEIERLKEVVADLIKVISQINDGSEYYTMFDNFQQDTRDFRYENYNHKKKG